MTEKRFNSVGSYLYDGDKAIGSFEDVSIREVMVELLNTLNDENEQLKCDKELFTKKQLHQENQRIKQTIREAYTNERTAIGKNVLKQLLEAIQ